MNWEAGCFPSLFFQNGGNDEILEYFLRYQVLGESRNKWPIPKREKRVYIGGTPGGDCDYRDVGGITFARGAAGT